LFLKDHLSKYEVKGRTSKSWLKIKRANAGMVDTLDLVPIGAFYGRGKMASIFSSFLMAAREGELYYPLCKLGIGFDKEFLQNVAQQI